MIGVLSHPVSGITVIQAVPLMFNRQAFRRSSESTEYIFIGEQAPITLVLAPFSSTELVVRGRDEECTGSAAKLVSLNSGICRP